MKDNKVASEAGGAVNSRWAREWLIEFDQALDPDNMPKLALAWEPQEIVFVAQGKEPFEVRYASRIQQAVSRINLEKLLKEATPETVKINEIIQLSEVTEKGDQPLYKYLLWGLLAAAVLMLLFMAKDLLRDMKNAQEES